MGKGVLKPLSLRGVKRRSNLVLYQRKRRFDRTPEPKGKPGKGKSPLRFVVQKHAASRTHYDFRLEIDGTLKSWAIPKGISLDPTDQRLAVQVEDHPIEYGAFEGVIPKGNYGAGTVMIWDRGTYAERTKNGLDQGHITFILQGEKLKGEFALIRLKGRDPKAWLLVKKRDEFMRKGEDLAEEVSVLSGRTMKQIAEQSVKKRDIWIPRQGKKESIPQRRILPMIAKISVAFQSGPEWIYEPFWRGKRATLEKQGHLLDGEYVGGKFIAYDLLRSQGKDLRELPLEARKKKLKGLRVFDKKIVYGEHTDEIPTSEKFIAKRKDSPYKSGIARDWLRVLKKSAEDSDERPRLHNLDKVFWPDEGYTKGDLLRYYDRIADFILPYLKDYPQSLHRQPDGLKDDGFFQKDHPGYLPKRIETVRVYSASSAKTINYLLCQDRWTLLFLVNLGCIELNPWISRRKDLDKPDYCVIDLDPDDNPFDQVIETALEVNRVLKKIGVRAWIKTSGASGLHICIPLGAKYDYDTSRKFAEAVCAVAHRRLKGFTSLERNPARRRGKIYLDFLQNRRGQTLAAPYCVRPKSGATVSTPLDWKEVKKGLDPSAFTIQTISRRLRRVGDLWKPLLSGAPGQDIPPALKKLRKIADLGAGGLHGKGTGKGTKK